MDRSVVRQFDETHIDEDCTLCTGEHSNKLFFNCTFDNLNDLTLKNCDLNQSQFLTEDIRKALGLTVTLNCFSFNNVTLSPLLFDLFLVLLMKTKGNDDKRKQLIDVVGEEQTDRMIRLLGHIE